MSKMEQSDHIESLIRDSYKREELAAQIQEYYEKCVNYFSDEDFKKLNELLYVNCFSWVRGRLKFKGCGSDDDVQMVVEQAIIAVKKIIKSNIENKIIIDQFVKYGFGIYRNKTEDHIRKVEKTKKRNPKFKELSGNEPDSTPDFGGKEEIEKGIQKLAYGLTQLYILSLLESGDFPPRCLALFYARLLPHLLSEDPYMQDELRSRKKEQDIDIEDDLQKLPSERKGYSARWAIKWMKKSSVGELTDESEEIIRRDISDNLAWCEKYRKKLDQEEAINGKTLRVGEIIYTETYDQNKTGKWAEDMHKKIHKIVFGRLYEDEELLELAVEYMQHDRFLKKIWIYL